MKSAQMSEENHSPAEQKKTLLFVKTRPLNVKNITGNTDLENESDKIIDFIS